MKHICCVIVRWWICDFVCQFIIYAFYINSNSFFFVGDSGYAQRPWMMTPVLGAAPGSPEEYYTNVHCRARNTVDRCIGVLKPRWRCLLAHRVLHYDPVTAGKIVNACVVLHNIANARNVPVLIFNVMTIMTTISTRIQDRRPE